MKKTHVHVVKFVVKQIKKVANSMIVEIVLLSCTWCDGNFGSALLLILVDAQL